ncbi:MAG: glycoside hydrolase family 2 [Clostridia bacterium]|nr:glycoside hydrolase family 2 [Clostridia bacterium]
MAKNDVFAGIAANGMSGRKDCLEETLPLAVPDIYFSEAVDVCPDITEISHIEKLSEFKKGINELKELYSPFLQRYCAQTTDTRIKKYINDFSFRFEHEEISRDITIPHYTGPAGRWTASYTSFFNADKIEPGEKVFLVFKGVDYIANVYVNDRYVGSHEGFFSPFEFEITNFLLSENKLEVIVKNDIPTIGNGDMKINGDKLYAATGPGWDGPEDGWHHCPAGGGIFDKVYLETRSESYIEDIFIKPDIDNGTAGIFVTYYSNLVENSQVHLVFNVNPYNFQGAVYKTEKTFPSGYGYNYYSIDIPMDEFRLWEMDTPWLYLVSVTDGYDSYEQTFGMRKFHMNDSEIPKGDLFLNNEPILLRGANEMGHLQLCVMRDDFEQLIEDILIAKYCNMNYYRMTQRPVQEEIYFYCDMLGMLCQTDLPLFGYMRKNKFHEGVKQAGEMERHVRNHPSVIMSTYINEPFAPEKYDLAHRHLSRRELELFFDACDAATYFENPDRVIKRVEGDYDPPTEKGMSDFHCYNMWYTNHALPIGMLYKGFLPALNRGWKTGCGEYGAEGLDNYEVMRKYYPADWLPENDDDWWISDKIVKSQTNTMHGDWYEEQSNITDWIDASQEHQAFATKLMTLAFRRRSDRIVSTAIHLLIDAWPSGWMKTLLDVDRVPKKAYFAFKESLEPLKVNLRSDRWSGYTGDVIPVEVWILNDLRKGLEGLSLRASLKINDAVISNHELADVKIKACSSIVAGVIRTNLPAVTRETKARMDICILKNGQQISKDSMAITIYPKPTEITGVFCVGKEAESVAESSPYLYRVQDDSAKAILVSSSEGYKEQGKNLPGGARTVFLMNEEKDKYYEINGEVYAFLPIFDPGEVGENGELKGLSFVALSDKMKQSYGKNDCSYWYNGEKDYIDHVAEYYVDVEPDGLYAFGFEKPPWGKRTEGLKRKLPVVCVKNDCVFMSFETKGRTGFNPVLDKIINQMLTGKLI